MNKGNNSDNNVNISKQKLWIYRIISIILVTIGFILVFTAMSNFNMGLFFVGGLFLLIGWPLFGISVLNPTLAKMSAHTQNVVLDENKDVLTEVSNKGADIKTPAVTKYAKAIKEGLKDETTVFCKHCGKKIDENSTFCKYCGNKQD